MSHWFFEYGWAIFTGAAIALGSLWNLRRRARRPPPRRRRAIDLFSVILGTAITLLTLLAWARGWK